jgi:hypothetical protein
MHDCHLIVSLWPINGGHAINWNFMQVESSLSEKL